jgi:glutathione gamma-glutamylcysteinyltransferase
VETLYRRPLPDDAIAFASAEGRAIFAEALADGTLGGYFALAEQFHTQSDPAYCGLGSLVVALNALAIDPGRLWKGPWRWFSEDLLDCCVTADQVRAQGIDLDTLACLARCNRAEAEVVRPRDDDELRAAIVDATAGPGTVLIAAYDRAALNQTGGGHFSPIGGYHRARDRVLVLDVARFKYPPHWIALPRLAAAMHTVDPATGRLRGFARLRRRDGAPTVGLTLTCAGCSWRDTAARLETVMAHAWPADTSLADVAAALAVLTPHVDLRPRQPADQAAAVERVLAALRATEAHAVACTVADGATADAIATLLLLAARRHAVPPGPLADALARVHAEVMAIPALAAELEQLAAQRDALATLPAPPG